MPRGSKPGERRGGRQRATPNKRTVLRDRILAVASGNPTATFLEFVPILVGDQALPADIRDCDRTQSARGKAFENSERAGEEDKSSESSSSWKQDLP